MPRTLIRPALPTLEMPEIIRLSSWMAAFNRDIPTRVLAAIAAGRGLVLVSSPGGVAASLHAAIVARLDQADLITVKRTAPLGAPEALSDAILGAVRGSDVGRSVILLIEGAEALAVATLRQLSALAALRRAGEPVLHVVLLGTPALRTRLTDAGLAGLWDDAAAHFRLVPELASCLPTPPQTTTPARQGTWLPPPPVAARQVFTPLSRRRPHRPAPMTMVWAGCAVAGLTAWSLLAIMPRTIPPAAPPPASNPIAFQPAFEAPPRPAPAPAAPIATIVPPVPRMPVAAPETPPASPSGFGDAPLHVTVRYRRDDAAALAAAQRLVSRLHASGTLVAGPLPSGAGAGAAVTYDFVQDQPAAAALASRLDLGTPDRTKTAGPGRPGEISIFIGARAQNRSSRE